MMDINNIDDRLVRFYVRDGVLVRAVHNPLIRDLAVTTVAGVARGRSYEHRCDRAAFETVAHALAEVPADGRGTSLCELARQERLAVTRVDVALAFLKDRGLVERRRRRCYPASAGGDLYLDAMIEFFALAEAGKEGVEG